MKETRRNEPTSIFIRKDHRPVDSVQRVHRVKGYLLQAHGSLHTPFTDASGPRREGQSVFGLLSASIVHIPKPIARHPSMDIKVGDFLICEVSRAHSMLGGTLPFTEFDNTKIPVRR